MQAALFSFSSIRHFIGNEGTTAIAEALKVCCLPVALLHCGGVCCVPGLLNLQVNCTLTDLILVHNAIGADGAAAIGEVLKVCRRRRCACVIVATYYR